MTKYSQNFEQDYILEYFKRKEKNVFFLEIGAYNPFKFSNTRALVELGAGGVYVEPSPKCQKEFIEEYFSNKYNHPRAGWVDNRSDGTKFTYSIFSEIFKIGLGGKHSPIILFPFAVGAEDKIVKFYDSKGDAISTTSLTHKEKWEKGYNVNYDEIQVKMISMQRLLSNPEIYEKVNFLNLDVEGTNIELFNLIPDWFWTDLKMLCIEHDNEIDYIIGKLQPFGFKELHRNGENLIMVK